MDIQDIIRDMAETTERVLSLNRRFLEFFAESAKKPENVRETVLEIMRDNASERASGPEFVSLSGAAEYTTLAKDTISGLVRSGKLPVCLTSENGRRIFRVEDLRAYLLSIRQPTKEEAHRKRSERAAEILNDADNRRERRRRHTWKTEPAKESGAGERT